MFAEVLRMSLTHSLPAFMKQFLPNRLQYLKKLIKGSSLSMYVYVSRVNKCQFFGKCCARRKWMIQKICMKLSKYFSSHCKVTRKFWTFFFTMLSLGVSDKMLRTKKVSVTGFFSKYDQISERSSLRDFPARNKSRKYC